MSDSLHIIIVLYNYCEYKIRYKLANEFINKYSNFPGIVLYVVELAYKKQNFHITTSNNKNHLQLRTNEPLWHKENLINIGIAKLLPDDWKYVSWMDCNLEFLNQDFVKKTIEKLKSNDVVQMFKTIKYNDSDIRYSMFYSSEKIKEVNQSNSHSNKIFTTIKGKVIDLSSRNNTSNKNIKTVPGGAFACTKQAYQKMGYLYDKCIVGGGDNIFACALVNKNILRGNVYKTGENTQYMDDIDKYIKKISNLKVSWVDNAVVYFHHGNLKNRNYHNRHFILNNYNPLNDVSYSQEGILHLKKKYKEDTTQEKIKNMFEDRMEDMTKTVVNQKITVARRVPITQKNLFTQKVTFIQKNLTVPKSQTVQNITVTQNFSVDKKSPIVQKISVIPKIIVRPKIDYFVKNNTK